MDGYPTTLIPSDDKTINTYLPAELLREILLYSIESNQIKSGRLASVCRCWRSVITAITHLWSTLRVGTWTEREQVTTWLQRAYPKKVVIDTQRDVQGSSNTLPFTALQGALASTGQWSELTISSFPSEDMASQLGFQAAMSMNVLKTLHVGVGCSHSPSLTRMLDLVPTEAPLSVLRLLSSFSSTHFLRPHWFPVLQDLTVLIVNGREIHEPFELLPAFTQLQTFEADHLPLPLYELDTNLPLLCTLRKLQLRASSVQWMAGRQFPCLKDCAILLPRHWEAVRQRKVQLPSCRKLTYHGHPMTTVEYFDVPKMRSMELRSHDCKEPRVCQQLHHLCTVVGRISNLTTLHIVLQCSEQAFSKVLRYFRFLQELVLSTAHPSPSWKKFLESLVAKPSGGDWPDWMVLADSAQDWEQWCSTQTWHANILPSLKYLGIRCPKGFSRSECLEIGPLLRHVGWTRAQLSPPLEHLKVWEGRETTDGIVVDYTSTRYLDKHLGISNMEYDSMVVRGMATQRMVINDFVAPIFQLHSTILFRQLQDLEVKFYYDHEIHVLPWLEQIKRLEISHGIIPEYSLDIDFPLIHTLQWLKLDYSTFSWMIGRSFKALREFQVDGIPDELKGRSWPKGLQMDLSACTTLKWWNFAVDYLHFLSCPNVQTLQLRQYPERPPIDGAAPKSLQDFLYNCSRLQKLDILISQGSGLHSLIRFVFSGALEQGIWHNIRSVEVKVRFISSSRDDRNHFFNRTAGHQQYYKKWWKEFTVTAEDFPMTTIVRASV
jgi:hypothetical protein